MVFDRSLRRLLRLALFVTAVFSATAVSAEAVDDLYALGDEFDSSLSAGAWTHRYAIEAGAVNQLERWVIDPVDRPGTMVLSPYTATWYGGYRGPIAFKNVTGDFVFTTRVSIDNRLGTGLPTSTFSLGGIMIRTPSTGPFDGEDYVFLSLGYGDLNYFTHPGPGPHFEVKTTTSGNSSLELTPAGTFIATLQLARMGSTVVALLQRPGDEWIVHRVYSRPDLPATLQVGLVAYTDWDKVSTYTPEFHNTHVLDPPIAGDPSTNPGLAFNPDIVAAFEFARWTRPVVPDGVNPATATPAELLSFLGGNALPSPPMRGDIDLDGEVDRGDAALFSRFFGRQTESIWTTGDFNGDEATTLADWGLLQSHIGQTVSSPSAATAVPEPAAWTFVLFGALVIVTFHRRR